MPPDLPRLMLVTDRNATRGRRLEDVVHAAAVGADGRLFVQVREPGVEDDELRELCERIAARVDPAVRIAVNGRPSIAAGLGIGLHLPARATAAEGGAPLTGRSVHDAAEADAALAERVDYAVIGTVFETDSHPGLEGRGLDHVRVLTSRLGAIPAYAIGGITAANAAFAIAAGAHGVAVRSGILAADNPAGAARTILAAAEAMAAALEPARR